MSIYDVLERMIGMDDPASRRDMIMVAMLLLLFQGTESNRQPFDLGTLTQLLGAINGENKLSPDLLLSLLGKQNPKSNDASKNGSNPMDLLNLLMNRSQSSTHLQDESPVKNSGDAPTSKVSGPDKGKDPHTRQ